LQPRPGLWLSSVSEVDSQSDEPEAELESEPHARPPFLGRRQNRRH
jgi:hypothetical protein